MRRGHHVLGLFLVSILTLIGSVFLSAQPGPSSGGGPGQTQANPIKLRELSANPASSTDVGILFTKEVAGITEIHYRDSAGNIRQLTPPGGGGVGTLADIYQDGTLKVNDATELDFLTSFTIATTTATHATIAATGQAANGFVLTGADQRIRSTLSATNGQLLIGSTGATPTAANLTAGSGVSIANGAGSITVSATGTGGTLVNVKEDAVTVVASATALDFTNALGVTASGTEAIVSVDNASTTGLGVIQLTENLGGLATAPKVIAVFASTTNLFWDQVITNGHYLQRSGTSIVGTATASPTAHAANHQDGGSDEISIAGLSGLAADAQNVKARRNSGADVGPQPRLNFIEGSNISITVASDAASSELDITFSTVASGTLADVRDDGVNVVTSARILDFGTNLSVTASGTDYAVVNSSGAADTYTATFVVAATSASTSASSFTHTTFASAVASATGATKIYLLPGTHAVAGLVTILTTGKEISVIGPGATLRLNNGANSGVLDITGTGSFYGSGFTVDGNKANNASGGTGINVLAALSRFALEEVLVKDCKTNGMIIGVATLSTIRNCVIQSCDTRGVLTGGGSGTVEFYGTTSKSNSGEGFLENGVTQLSYVGCAARSNGTVGFSTLTTGANNIAYRDCTADSNGGVGFMVGNFSTEFTGCLARSNSGSGYDLSNGTHVLSACQSRSNTGNGFAASSSGRARFSACLADSNTTNGFVLSGVVGSTVTGCSSTSNGTAAANTYDGILIIGASNYHSITGNTITGTGHRYHISEVTSGSTPDFNLYSANKFSDAAATANQIVLGAASRILDPGVIALSITRAAASGTAAEVIDSANYPTVAHFKPTSIEFIGSDDGDQAVYSDGHTDSSQNVCHAHDTTTDAADLTNSINITNAAGNGYTATVDLLGKASGSTQEGFRIQWTVAGTGRAITVKALLRR